MKLSFHGGAREVTGACYLLETGQAKILIDCGLFQGSRECEDLNFAPFSFNPGEIDALIVTHAHIDHIGRIPRLVREGFRGAIYSTAPTRALAEVLLADALRIAERENEALYSQEDLARTLAIWKELPYHAREAIGDIQCQLSDAGHILGSALVEMRAEGNHFLL